MSEEGSIFEADMAILKHYMKVKYSMTDSQAEYTIFDFTKQKQVHSQQIRDFYEHKCVVPLNLSLGYVSYLLIQICEQLQYNVYIYFSYRNTTIMQLLKTRGRKIMQDILQVAEKTLNTYKENISSMDLECSIDDLVRYLFIDHLRREEGLSGLISLIV